MQPPQSTSTFNMYKFNTSTTYMYNVIIHRHKQRQQTPSTSRHKHVYHQSFIKYSPKKQTFFINVSTTIIIIKLHIRSQQHNSIHVITTFKYQH